MPRVAAATPEPNVPGLHYWGASAPATGQPAGEQLVGLSFGIRERDPWSEFLSNRYGVPTVLYDCFWREDQGPMGTQDYRAASLGLAECDQAAWRNGVCYSAPYKAKQVCLGGERNTWTRPQRDASGNVTNVERTYETLEDFLRGRKPLSVFLKIDIEGSEWEPLAWLLDHPEEMRKIRTLDMEAHVDQWDPRDRILERFSHVGHVERHVRVMERLAKDMAVVGSTIESYHRDFDANRRARARGGLAAPQSAEPSIYNTNGYALDQYCISFVNRELL